MNKRETLIVQLGDETLELREMKANQRQQVFALPEDNAAARCNLMLMHSVYQNGKPRFATTEQAGDIDATAWDFLVEQYVSYYCPKKKD